MGVPRLRILAGPAVMGAALKEEDIPDARPVHCGVAHRAGCTKFHDLIPPE